MENRDIVTGDELINVLTYLLRHQSFISMRLVPGDYERLTLLTDLRVEPEGSFLAVDPPTDLATVWSTPNGHTFEFGFKGPDGLNYRFAATDAVIHPSGLRFPIPSVLKRIQRRRNFRVAVPPGTLLSFELASGPVDLDILNISLGGILGALTQRSKGSRDRPKLKRGETIRDLYIYFPDHEGRNGLKVGVHKAVVRRVESDGIGRKSRYAFEFIRIERDGKTALTRMIYALQRQQLQRR